MRAQVEALAALQRIDQSPRENTQALQAGESRVAALEEAVQAHETAARTIEVELAEAATRQRDLEGRLAVAESKMKDRRMRITRIRNDKELGLAKREVELLKEETGGLETELMSIMEQVDAATKRLEAARTELGSLTAARDDEAAPHGRPTLELWTVRSQDRVPPDARVRHDTAALRAAPDGLDCVARALPVLGGPDGRGGHARASGSVFMPAGPLQEVHDNSQGGP